MEHGGRMVAKALKSRGVSHLFTLSGGHLFSIYDGCRAEGIEIVDVRHEQSAVVRRRGLREGDPQRRGRGAHRGPRSDQRDERDRRRPGERIAGLRSRRTGAGAALGRRLAAGDRSPPLRLTSGQGRADRQGPGPDRGDDRRRARPRRRGAERPDLPRLPARRRLQRGGGRGPRPSGDRRVAPRPASRRRRRCWRGPSGRRSWPGPVSTGEGERMGSAPWPSCSGSRSSSTASAAGACRRITSSPSAGPAAPASATPTSPF